MADGPRAVRRLAVMQKVDRPPLLPWNFLIRMDPAVRRPGGQRGERRPGRLCTCRSRGPGALGLFFFQSNKNQYLRLCNVRTSPEQLPTQGQGLDNLQCKESILFERGKGKIKI